MPKEPKTKPEIPETMKMENQTDEPEQEIQEESASEAKPEQEKPKQAAKMPIYKPTGDVKCGSKGKDVSVLQGLLGLQQTGIADTKLHNAIYEFQRKNELPITCIADGKMFDMLQKQE
jgi:hypothetical protein